MPQIKGLPSSSQKQLSQPSLPSLPDAAVADGDNTQVVATANDEISKAGEVGEVGPGGQGGEVGAAGGQTAHRLKLLKPTHPHMQAMAVNNAWARGTNGLITQNQPPPQPKH